METSIAKQQKVVVVRGGIYLYFDADKVDKIAELIKSSPRGQIITLAGQMVNTSEITGIFDPKYIEEMMMIKRGMWRCVEKGHWNERNAKKCTGCYL